MALGRVAAHAGMCHVGHCQALLFGAGSATAAAAAAAASWCSSSRSARRRGCNDLVLLLLLLLLDAQLRPPCIHAQPQVQEFKNQEEPGVPPLFDEEAQPKAPEKGGPLSAVLLSCAAVPFA